MTLAVTIAAVLAGAAGAGVAWFLPVRSEGRRWLGVVAPAAGGIAAAGAVGLVALVVLAFAGLDRFGIMHLAYLGVCLALPAVGLALAARTVVRRLPRPSRLPRWALVPAVGLLVPAPVGWYATHVEPYRLAVDTVTYPVDPARAGDSPVRIGVLADLQTNDPGDHEHRAVDRLLRAEPDVILLPGDLFQGTTSEWARHRDDMRSLLARLHAPGGVFFVAGDAESWRPFAELLEGTDIVTLDDEVVEVTVGDRHLLLGGNRLDHRTPTAAAMRAELEGAPGDDAIRILMSHRPDAVLDLAEGSPVDLTIAGHTHGGQVVLPGFGPLITLTSVPRHVARGGLHEVGGHDIYVSTGVGLERGQAPQVRLFSRPTIGVIDLSG